MSAEKKVTRKRIGAARDMGKFMAKYYLELDHASRTGEKKIAWCTSVGPAEILRGMGYLVYFPETHSAMLGATRTATDYIPHANALGYSPEICSYLTSDVGAYVQGFTPLARAYGIESIPKPDVLVFNTNQCRDVQDWFAWYAKQFGAPLVGVHTHRGVQEVTENHVVSISRQMEALIEPLEQVMGKQFDMDRFKEAVALSRECSELWKKVLDTAAATPSPLTFFDGTTLMGPAVVGRGTQEAVDYYRDTAGRAGRKSGKRRGGCGGRAVQNLLGRHAHLGQAEGPFRVVRRPGGLRACLYLLQQLDIQCPGSRGSICEHGSGVHRAVHRAIG